MSLRQTEMETNMAMEKFATEPHSGFKIPSNNPRFIPATVLNADKSEVINQCDVLAQNFADRNAVVNCVSNLHWSMSNLMQTNSALATANKCAGPNARPVKDRNLKRELIIDGIPSAESPDLCDNGSPRNLDLNSPNVSAASEVQSIPWYHTTGSDNVSPRNLDLNSPAVSAASEAQSIPWYPTTGSDNVSPRNVDSYSPAVSAASEAQTIPWYHTTGSDNVSPRNLDSYSPAVSAASEAQSIPWYPTTDSNNVSMEDVHRAVCGFLAGTSDRDRTVVKREGERCSSPWLSFEASNASKYQTTKNCDIINIPRDVDETNYLGHSNLQSNFVGAKTVVNSTTSNDPHSPRSGTLQKQSSHDECNQKKVNTQINNSEAKTLQNVHSDMTNGSKVKPNSVSESFLVPTICSVSVSDLLGRRKQVDNGVVDSCFVRNNDSTFKCKLCPAKTLNRRDKMQTHVRVHLGLKPYDCTVKDCKAAFSAWDALVKHVNRHAFEGFQCLHCTRKFRCLRTLRDHQNVHTGEKPYKCKECGLCFHMSSTLGSHIKSKHDSKLQCDMCGKMYNTYGGLQAHIKQAHQNLRRLYECEKCNKRYDVKRSFDDHLRWHEGEEPYCCSLCSKSYESKRSLSKHIKRHSRQRPFECSKCNKCFANKTYLNGHLRQHDGIKKYCCQVCGKTFTYAHYLQSHMKSHGEKNFICAICGGKFNRKDNLKSHIIRQHQGSKCKNKNK